MGIMQIKNRWTGEVIYEAEAESLRLLVISAVKSGKSLRGSDLRDSDLRGSDLRGSNLSGSNLRGSDLSGSDLRGSDLRGSDLSGSDLSGSDLRGSDLRGSDLRGSDLSDSDLRGSDLRGSDLSGSNLSGSDLTPIRDDFWAVLSATPGEVPALREKIVEGKINGSAYEGSCACLVGTIANARGCAYVAIPGLLPNASRPIERFFMGIAPGQTPENHEPSRIVLGWLDDWVSRMSAAFGSKA